MKDIDRPISAGADERGLARKPGQSIEALYDEAYRLVEPIFRGNDRLVPSTLMFRAMQTLHGRYPHLSEGELDALFMGMLKHKRHLVRHH